MTKRIRPYVQTLGAAALVAQVFIFQACGSNSPNNTPGSAGTSGTGRGGTTGSGVAGTTGSGGTSPTGTAGSGSAGTDGTGSAGTSGAFPPQPSCTGLTTAAGVEPTKGGACVPADPQVCYKTCGPVKEGAKSETCTGGVYAEMSGCSFDPTKEFSCYRIPSAANPSCPAGVTPESSFPCDVPHCTLCNSLQGIVGGSYFDATGAAPKFGWCVCQEPNANGLRTWSCASDTAWPCPLGAGC